MHDITVNLGHQSLLPRLNSTDTSLSSNTNRGNLMRTIDKTIEHKKRNFCKDHRRGRWLLLS